jgi:predicted phosphodiesterase
MSWVKAFAPLSERLIIPSVPGNHDEVHRIALNDPTDSWQLDIASAVQDACAENPALAHVEFRYPERDNSTLAIELSGVLVGMAHGHQMKGNVERWIEKQASGRTQVGSADIILTAHLHHFIAKNVGGRLWIQTPALDGGSAWFRDSNGLDSPTGIVSLVIGDGYDPRRDLAVLAGEPR